MMLVFRYPWMIALALLLLLFSRLSYKKHGTWSMVFGCLIGAVLIGSALALDIPAREMIILLLPTLLCLLWIERRRT